MKTRTIEKKLKDVQALPGVETHELLGATDEEPYSEEDPSGTDNAQI